MAGALNQNPANGLWDWGQICGPSLPFGVWLQQGPCSKSHLRTVGLCRVLREVGGFGPYLGVGRVTSGLEVDSSPIPFLSGLGAKNCDAIT